MAAGVIIVREAGGYVTDLDGNERTMEPGDIIAGNEDMQREVMGLLKAAWLNLPCRRPGSGDPK